MKRFFTLTLTVLLLTSCDKLFKDDYRNQLNLETDEDYKNARAVLYNFFYNSVCGIGEEDYSVNMIFMSIGNGDDLSLGDPGYLMEEDNKSSCYYTLESNIFHFYGYCQRPTGPSPSITHVLEADFTQLYKRLFQTIGYANDILSKVKNESELSISKKEIIGEVYFVRAYCHFRLARTYGQVPIINNPDVDYTLKKPTFKELYDFIEKDILKSIELLPVKSQIPYETPSIGTAKALLAEVYLTMGGYPVYDNSKYAKAAKIAGEVISSSSDYGFGLLTDFADLWNGTKIKNMESVLAFYENLKGKIYPFRRICCVPRVFYNNFPKDYRKEMTFQTKHVPYILKQVFDTVKKRPYTAFDSLYLKHYDSIDNSTKIFYKKYYSNFNTTDLSLLREETDVYNLYGVYSGKVYYVLRYAQTLLTYAEAKARSGNLDASAYDAVNQIRRRANKVDLFSPSPFDLKPGLTAEQFADSVVQERAWELCAELEGRWFDLVRLNKAKDLIELKQDQYIITYPIEIDRSTYFQPIPVEDRNLNPNLQ